MDYPIPNRPLSYGSGRLCDMDANAIFLSCIGLVVAMVARSLKILLFVSLTATLVLPGMYFGGIIPITVVTQAWSPVYSNEKLVEYSEMVMHGTLVDSSSYVEWHVSGNMAVPSVYTVWSLQQSESIKGQDFKTVDFVVNGGTYSNIVHKSMHDTELNKGDVVIVFLTKDTDSIYRDHYYLTGIESGIYKISDGVATNSYVKSSYDVDSLKSSLRSFD